MIDIPEDVQKTVDGIMDEVLANGWDWSTEQCMARAVLAERERMEGQLKPIGWMHRLAQENHEDVVELSEGPECPWEEFPADAIIFSSPVFVVRQPKPNS